MINITKKIYNDNVMHVFKVVYKDDGNLKKYQGLGFLGAHRLWE